jgi:hypothetical protein
VGAAGTLGHDKSSTQSSAGLQLAHRALRAPSQQTAAGRKCCAPRTHPVSSLLPAPASKRLQRSPVCSQAPACAQLQPAYSGHWWSELMANIHFPASPTGQRSLWLELFGFYPADVTQKRSCQNRRIVMCCVPMLVFFWEGAASASITCWAQHYERPPLAVLLGWELTYSSTLPHNSRNRIQQRHYIRLQWRALSWLR